MLPSVVLEIIFSLLPIADLFNASRTCKHFNRIISRSSFLRHKKRYFKFRFNASDDIEKELKEELAFHSDQVCMTYNVSNKMSKLISETSAEKIAICKII